MSMTLSKRPPYLSTRVFTMLVYLLDAPARQTIQPSNRQSSASVRRTVCSRTIHTSLHVNMVQGNDSPGLPKLTHALPILVDRDTIKEIQRTIKIISKQTSVHEFQMMYLFFWPFATLFASLFLLSLFASIFVLFALLSLFVPFPSQH